MIGQAKRAEIQTAATTLLVEGRVEPYDARAMDHALKRIAQPLSSEEGGTPGHTEADRDLMFEVLVYRTNKYLTPERKIHLKEL
jgi:hypothetical protein